MSNTLEAKLKLDIAELIANQAKAQQETKKWIDGLRSEGRRGAQAVDTIAASTKRATEFVKAGQAAGRINLGGVAMQAQDIAVQLQMGTQASIVLAQQGSQILSAFGMGGAIAGGVLAIGGALYSAQKAGEEAFRALVKENETFDASLRKIISRGSMSEMVDQIETMKTGAKELREAASAVGYFDPIKRFFSKTTFDANGVGTNQMDAKRAEQTKLANQEEAGRLKLIQEVISLSRSETEMVRLRAEGRNAEADALERTIKLAKRLSDINDMPAEVQSALRNDAYAKAAAEASAARKSQFEAAFSEAEKLNDQRVQFEQKKRQAALDEMPTAQKIAALQVDLNRAIENEKMLRADFVPDARKILNAEENRLQLQITLNNAMKDYRREQEASANAARAEAVQRERIKQAQDQWIANRNAAVQGGADDLAMMKARATRRTSDDYRVSRDIAIRTRRDQLMRDEGLGMDEATARATQMRNLEEKANGTARIRNTGIKRGTGSNLDAFFAQQGKAWGVNAPGESAFARLQRQGFGWEKELIPGMAGRQARNEAAQSQVPAGTPTVALSNREIEILTKIADGIIGFVTN